MVIHWRIFASLGLNEFRPSAALMRQWMRWSTVYIIACRLVGNEPVYKLIDYQFDLSERSHVVHRLILGISCRKQGVVLISKITNEKYINIYILEHRFWLAVSTTAIQCEATLENTWYHENVHIVIRVAWYDQLKPFNRHVMEKAMLFSRVREGVRVIFLIKTGLVIGWSL